MCSLDSMQTGSGVRSPWKKVHMEHIHTQPKPLTLHCQPTHLWPLTFQKKHLSWPMKHLPCALIHLKCCMTHWANTTLCHNTYLEDISRKYKSPQNWYWTDKGTRIQTLSSNVLLDIEWFGSTDDNNCLVSSPLIGNALVSGDLNVRTGTVRSSRTVSRETFKSPEGIWDRNHVYSCLWVKIEFNFGPFLVVTGNSPDVNYHFQMTSHPSTLLQYKSIVEYKTVSCLKYMKHLLHNLLVVPKNMWCQHWVFHAGSQER